MGESAAKRIGEGIAWLGFWIGLGLYNFQGQGCSPREKNEIRETIGIPPKEKNHDPAK